MPAEDRQGTPRLILASASRVRARILADAGIACIQRAADVDETTLKAEARTAGISIEETAFALAEAKALAVAAGDPDALVIGADQILECDGILYDKPADMAVAAAHLRSLSGRVHRLVSAVCVAASADVLWRHVETPRLTMRRLDGAFIADYLDGAGRAVLDSVGAYRLEATGAHLFARIEGDYFTILGLPLLALLDFLRRAGAIPG